MKSVPGAATARRPVGAVRAAVGVDHLRAALEHRDDDGTGLAPRRTASVPDIGDAEAGFARRLDGGGEHVEADDLVSGGGEVLRHRQAHVAEAQECDLHRASSFRLRTHRAASSSSRPMMTRMISFVPSRIWCTRRSRTTFSMPYS